MIKETASKAIEKDEKTKKRSLKKLSKSISELKWDTVEDHTQEFESLKKFEAHLKQAKKVSEELAESMNSIETAIS